MDPVKLQRMLHWIGTQRGAGQTTEQIDAQLRARGPQYRTVADYMAAAAAGAQPQPPASIPVDMARGALAVGQGAAGNFLDELAGSLAASRGVLGAFDPSTYQWARDAVRGQEDAFRAEHPIASPALNVAGAVLPSNWLLAPFRGAGLVGRIGIGATAGGVFGAGAAPELADLPASTGLGAVAGAVATPVAELVLKGGSGVLDALYSRFLQRSPIRAARVLAARMVRNMGRQAGLAPDIAAAKLAQLEAVRPGLSIPADITGQTQDALRTSINTGQGNVDDVLNFLRQRSAGARDRLAGDLQATGGADIHADILATPGTLPNAASIPQRAAALLQSVGRRVYAPFETAAPHGFDPTPELKALLTDPDVAAQWARVRPLAGKQGSAVIQSLVDQGVPPARAEALALERGVGFPTFNHFNTLIQNLKGSADQAMVSGNGSTAHHYRGLARQVQDAMERVPGMEGLAAANREYAQAASVQRAFESGQTMRAPQIDALTARDIRQIAADAGPYAPQAVDAYRKGVMNSRLRALLAHREGGNVAEQFRSIARNLFPNDDAFERWMQSALADGTFNQTLQGAVGGSTTARQLAGLQTLEGSTAGTPEVTIAPRVVWYGKMPLAGLVARFHQATQDPAVAAAIANRFRRLLGTPGRVNRDAFLQALAGDNTDAAIQAAHIEAPTVIGTAAGGVAGGSATGQRLSGAAMEGLRALLARYQPPADLTATPEPGRP